MKKTEKTTVWTEQKIQQKMAIDRRGWRVPSKADWDALLNSIEPCEYRNHTSAKCHVELGKYAGKFLKSECGWCNQPQCECSSIKPTSGCEPYSDFDDDQFVFSVGVLNPLDVLCDDFARLRYRDVV